MFPCDLGANWVHNYDATKNPIINLATSFGLHLTKFDWTNNPSFDEKGNPVSASIMTTGDAKINKLKKDAATYAEAKDTDISLDAALKAVIQKQSLTFNSYEKAMLYASLLDEYATEPSNLSAWWYDATGPWDDSDGVILEGFGAFADQLAKGLPISLNQKVVKVDYSFPSSSRVTVTTAAGFSYSAAQVLVTVPLGVLKKGIITFNPPLPTSMTNAINLLGVGVLNHVFLHFPRGTLKALQPSLSAVDSFSKLPSDSTLNGRGYVEVVSMYRLRQQDILFAEASGSFAVAMEAKNDSRIVAEVMKELRLVYPGLPKPINYTITRWNKDPFAFGSYSYLGVGATGYGAKSPTTLETLAIGINNKRVFFAGEHTSNAYLSSVQGAYESGLSAATKMLSVAPSRSPTTRLPSNPIKIPTTSLTRNPTLKPSPLRTALPTTSRNPTAKPTTKTPTKLPTMTMRPSLYPSPLPSSFKPSVKPSLKPTASSSPSLKPSTAKPSLKPSSKPTASSSPSLKPSTAKPSLKPSLKPTASSSPSLKPSTAKPSLKSSTAKPTLGK